MQTPSFSLIIHLVCCLGLLTDTVQTDLSAIDTINPFTTWSNFGDCSVSCGKGTKKRVIKCQPKGNERNQNCPPGTESYTERVPCTNPSCPGNIIFQVVSTKAIKLVARSNTKKF